MSSNESDDVTPKGEKIFYFIRHGITEMNEKLHEIGWANPDFVDFDLWDTRLSTKGVKEAVDLHEKLSDSTTDASSMIKWDSVEVILASPLTRTMQTADYLFFHKNCLFPDHVPKIAHPLLRERLYMSSDVGRMKKEISVEFPDWKMDAVPDSEAWWYEHNEYLSTSDGDGNTALIPNPYVEWRPPGVYSCKGEPKENFRTRLKDLRSWLLSRPESTLLVVCHWGVIRGLTGLDVRNCEITKLIGSEMLTEPFIDY